MTPPFIEGPTFDYSEKNTVATWKNKWHLSSLPYGRSYVSLRFSTSGHVYGMVIWKWWRKTKEKKERKGTATTSTGNEQVWTLHDLLATWTVQWHMGNENDTTATAVVIFERIWRSRVTMELLSFCACSCFKSTLADNWNNSNHHHSNHIEWNISTFWFVRKPRTSATKPSVNPSQRR